VKQDLEPPLTLSETANIRGVASAPPLVATAVPTTRPHGETLYQLPVRVWHWLSVLAILVLVVTGYLIGAPLPSASGEASAHYSMGYIRVAHFVAGYVLAVSFLGRLYWACVGNPQAREIFTLPLLSAAYWRDLGRMLKWYTFLGATPDHPPGHNALARVSMVFGYTLLTLFMSCTGFALYSEGCQPGHWSARWFGWILPLLGQSQNVHTLHRLGMWAMLLFVIVHVYAVLRDDIVGPYSTISSMISGKRAHKE